MDFSNFETYVIRCLASSYDNAAESFNIEPIEASANMQKKIRKWMNKHHFSFDSNNKQMMQLVGKKVSDADVIRTTKECSDYITQFEDDKKKMFESASADLSDDIKEIIWEMLGGGVQGGFIRDGSNIKFLYSYNWGYNYFLVLKNASGMPVDKFYYFYFADGTFTKQDGIYKLSGCVEDFDNDSTAEFTIEFTDIETEFVTYRADTQQLLETPWSQLQSVADSIISKYLLLPNCLNEKERAILPLLSEIKRLDYFGFVPDEFETGELVNLKSYIDKHDFKELRPLIEKAGKLTFSSKNRGRTLSKINETLNKQKYEPLWREIYNLIADSQAEYPSRVEACCNAHELAQIRDDIQAFMEERGYSGRYPDFIKRGKIRGLHLVDSYDQSYFVAPNKNAVFRIHCTEQKYLYNLSIGFLIATELVPSGSQAKDINSCLFDCNGKCFYSVIDYEHTENELDADELEQIVEIAAKKAEFKKLTKQEKAKVQNSDLAFWRIFCFMFFVCGGLFGVFMTLSFTLLSALIFLMFGQIASFPSFFMDVPWWHCLAFSWVAFGGIMGVISVISKIK